MGKKSKRQNRATRRRASAVGRDENPAAASRADNAAPEYTGDMRAAKRAEMIRNLELIRAGRVDLLPESVRLHMQSVRRFLMQAGYDDNATLDARLARNTQPSNFLEFGGIRPPTVSMVEIAGEYTRFCGNGLAHSNVTRKDYDDFAVAMEYLQAATKTAAVAAAMNRFNTLASQLFAAVHEEWGTQDLGTTMPSAVATGSVFPRTSCQACGRVPKKLVKLYCSHTFCIPCIVKHGKQHETCPVCDALLCWDVHLPAHLTKKDLKKQDVCFWCRKEGPRRSMNVCDVCYPAGAITSYCSKECQNAAWLVHKRTAHVHCKNKD